MWLFALACATSTPPGVSPFVEPVPDAIYLAMVDRFEDGEANTQSVNPSDPQDWHGGDIQGVIRHLDRLQELGIRQLWLTPLNSSRQQPFGQWAPTTATGQAIGWRSNPDLETGTTSPF